MDRLDSLGSETGYLSLGRHAEWSERLSTDMVGAKAKMSEKMVRHEFRFVENGMFGQGNRLGRRRRQSADSDLLPGCEVRPTYVRGRIFLPMIEWRSLQE